MNTTICYHDSDPTCHVLTSSLLPPSLPPFSLSLSLLPPLSFPLSLSPSLSLLPSPGVVKLIGDEKGPLPTEVCAATMMW